MENAVTTYCPNPIIPASNPVYFFSKPLDGEHLCAYLQRINFRPEYTPVYISVNGAMVEPADIARTYIKSDDLIVIKSGVHNGGDGGSDPMQLALIAGAAYFTAGGSLSLSGGALAITLPTSGAFGFALAAGLVLNSLAPSVPDAGKNNDQKQHTLTGGSNAARPNQPMMVVYGQHLVYPDQAAKEYTEFQGVDQFLYQQFHFGLGDLEIGQLMLENTPLSNYDGVVIEESVNGALANSYSNVDTIAGQRLEHTDGWVSRFTASDTFRVAVDITGLVFERDKTGTDPETVVIGRRYREVGVNDWTYLDDVSITNKQPTPIRRTYKWDFPRAGKYEVALYKVTTDQDAGSGKGDTNRLEWKVLRGYQTDAADYSGQTKRGVEIQASGQLSNKLNRVSAVVKRRVQILTGDTETTAYSSNPAWCLLAFFRGIYIDGKLVHGLGYNDSQIDIEGIKDWAAWCDENGLEFNYVLTQKISRMQFAEKIAGAGRASITDQTGKFGVVYDDEDKTFTGVLNMSNIIAGSFSINYTTSEVAEEIIGQYVNPDLNYEIDQVSAVLPGVENPTREATIRLEGVTSKTIAQQEVNLQAAAQHLLSKRYKMTVDARGLLIKRGDVVLLSHDLSSYASSGRLISGTATELVLSRPVVFSGAENHYIVIQTPNNNSYLREVLVQSGESDTITLVEPLDFVINDDEKHSPEDYIFNFDPTETPGKRIKIISQEPQENKHVALTAIDDLPEYYAAKNNLGVINNASSRVTQPRIISMNVSEELIKSSNGFVTSVIVDLTVSGSYNDAVIYAGLTGDDLAVVDSIRNTVRATFIAKENGLHTIKAVPGNELVQEGPPFSASYYVKGKDFPPNDVDNFRVSTDVDGTRIFEASASQDVDFAGYVIHWSTGVVTQLSEMNPLHEGLLTALPYETNQLAGGVYTFAIIAQDTSANKSEPVFIQAELSDPRSSDSAYYEDVSNLGWIGTKTNCIVDSKNVLTATGNYQWDDLATWDNWNTWTENPHSQIIYEHNKISLSAVIEFLPVIAASSGVSNSVIEISHSVDDISYTAWVQPSEKISARYLKVRLTVNQTASEVITVSKLLIKLSTEVLEEVINDVDTATLAGSAATGRIIPLANNYSVITQILVTIQDVTSARSYTIIDKHTTQPKIKIFNGSTPVDELVDITIKGIASV